ncbi:MAG: hypothetical protein PHU93_03365, partial [Candidatus Gracilibacteria bacterium]|nr:hypothetical protein [Candidatus Gracilibacteria bacterium]
MKSITPPYTVSQYILCSIGIFLLGIGITIGSLLSVPHLLESIGIHGGSSHKVHYHANFLVYLKTEFINFDGDEYMEELASCSVDPSKESPEDRVHLHSNTGSLIHIHDAGVTWGHFMSNIGWNFGSNYLVDSKNILHRARNDVKLRFVLNGAFIENPQNREIRSTDRLLIDFSVDSDAQVLERFKQVAETAAAQNHLPD